MIGRKTKKEGERRGEGDRGGSWRWREGDRNIRRMRKERREGAQYICYLVHSHELHSYLFSRCCQLYAIEYLQ